MDFKEIERKVFYGLLEEKFTHIFILSNGKVLGSHGESVLDIEWMQKGILNVNRFTFYVHIEKSLEDREDEFNSIFNKIFKITKNLDYDMEFLEIDSDIILTNRVIIEEDLNNYGDYDHLGFLGYSNYLEMINS